MANNIAPLEEELKARAEENAELAAENFAKTSLSDEEREKVSELEKETHTVVVTTDPEGRKVETTIEEFAAKLDKAGTIPLPDGSGGIKAVNTGDIVKTAEDIKAEVRDKAIKLYRDLSVTGDDEMSDEDILAINDAALAAVQEYFHEDRLDSDITIRKLSKLSLDELVAILPEKFVNIYATPNEIKVKNYKAKERLLSTIAYLTATGPEMDYLNEYIDHEHRMMDVSRRIMSLQVELSEAIRSKEKFSEIIKRATDIEPDDTSVWAKHIKLPNRIHNEFAQRAAVCEEYRLAYEKLLDEYPIVEPDGENAGEVKAIEDSRAMIQEQIDECASKYQAYTNVTELTLVRELMGAMIVRFKSNKKNNYKNMEREAIDSLDRIRRAKQNVPFPVYDKRFANKPALLYSLYMKAFPKMMEAYNKTLLDICEKDEAASLGEVTTIHADGYDDGIVHEYFSMILLILFGRVMKKLGDRGRTKYDAIALDSYFNLYCMVGTDIYIMSDMWAICKDFVLFCIDNYPKSSKK